jgi:hypothetical protein
MPAGIEPAPDLSADDMAMWVRWMRCDLYRQRRPVVEMQRENSDFAADVTSSTALRSCRHRPVPSPEGSGVQ